MNEMTMHLHNDAHRQNIEREFQQEQKIRDAKLACQDEKREKNHLKRLQQKLTRKTR
jgi:hypothetical protein